MRQSLRKNEFIEQQGSKPCVVVRVDFGGGVNSCYNWVLDVLYSFPIWGRKKPCECNELRIQDGEFSFSHTNQLPHPNPPQVGEGTILPTPQSSSIG